MDVGIVLLSHEGCWDDAAYAEANGFTTAGFVDSPLIAGDPFVAMALTAQRTANLRIGPMLAIPSNRNAAACVTAVVCLAACLLPAERAAQISPMEALAEE